MDYSQIVIAIFFVLSCGEAVRGQSVLTRGLPYEVNFVKTCESKYSLDSATLTGIQRGVDGAPCSGYVQFETDTNGKRRVCADDDELYNKAAEDLCATLGVSFHRVGNNSRMLYRCFTYREQGVDSAAELEEIFDLSNQMKGGHRHGCENMADDDSKYTCFDDCHTPTTPAPGPGTMCDENEPFLAVACSDIDECLNGKVDHCEYSALSSCLVSKACGDNTLCTNHVGSYECTCQDGFKAAGDLAPYEDGCTDINECEENQHTCKGDAVCCNTIGSYICLCPTGQTWNDTTQTCSGTMCGFPAADPHANRTESEGKDGDFIIYTCLDGFKAPDGSSSYTSNCRGGEWGYTGKCTDIDECNPTQCDPNADCVNGPGYFYCYCKAGFTGDGHTCTKEECDPIPSIEHATPPSNPPTPPVFGDTVLYTCDPGYQVSIQNQPTEYVDQFGIARPNSFEITCNAKGEYTPDPVPACLPISCGDPGTVANSHRSMSGFLLGMTATYTCQNGYKPTPGSGDSFDIECQADGHWTPKAKCEDVNECEEDADICGGIGKYCYNNDGSYMCSCIPWMQASSNNDQCVDWGGHVEFPDFKPCEIMNSLGMCQFGQCSIDRGKAHCGCLPGWTGAACDRRVISLGIILGIVCLILIAIFAIMLVLWICCRPHSHVRPLPPAPRFNPLRLRFNPMWQRHPQVQM